MSWSAQPAPERVVNGPCWYLLNARVRWVFELGRGEFWHDIPFGAVGWKTALHSKLVDLFQDQFTGDLSGLSQWIDGVVTRLSEFIPDDLTPLDVRITSSETEFGSRGWPIVAHTYAENWPEKRCPACLSVINGPGQNYHTRMCSSPDALVKQKWGHWNLNDD